MMVACRWSPLSSGATATQMISELRKEGDRPLFCKRIPVCDDVPEKP